MMTAVPARPHRSPGRGPEEVPPALLAVMVKPVNFFPSPPYAGCLASFGEDTELLPLFLALGEFAFPEPGLYTFQVWFTSGDAREALKAEHPFHALTF